MNVEKLLVGLYPFFFFFLHIREFVVVRKYICVTHVKKMSGGVLLLMTISICIRGKDPMSAIHMVIPL